MSMKFHYNIKIFQTELFQSEIFQATFKKSDNLHHLYKLIQITQKNHYSNLF